MRMVTGIGNHHAIVLIIGLGRPNWKPVAELQELGAQQHETVRLD
jgi:hypothetical protein